jgi:hypothetical protein
MPSVIIRRSPSRNILIDTSGTVHDLSRYFTVTRDRQGVRADRAGEFQSGFVNPVRDWLLSR